MFFAVFLLLVMMFLVLSAARPLLPTRFTVASHAVFKL